jgi:hypothetical protein
MFMTAPMPVVIAVFKGSEFFGPFKSRPSTWRVYLTAARILKFVKLFRTLQACSLVDARHRYSSCFAGRGVILDECRDY